MKPKRDPNPGAPENPLPKNPPASDEPNEVIDAARDLGREQKWGEAAQVLAPLIESLPGAVELWLQLAQWQQLAGDVRAAQSTLRRAIEKNSEHAALTLALWHALAQHLFEAQEWAQAAQAATKALSLARRLFPRLGRSVPSLALARGEWARGGELRAEQLREHELLEMLATSRAHEGKFEAAGQAMRELLALSPRDPLHRMRLASLLQSHGALGEAAREFERVMEMVPETFFASDAEAALDVLDKAQIQQILTRASEERDFGHRLERDMDSTLIVHAFHLSEGGRESLRQMIDDGRPDLSSAPRVH